jgi:uncharacterized small protein (DUF1192 family)
MTKFDEIFTIANELTDAGQQPTVALIKAKLSTKVPLPVIISAFKQWQYQPKESRKSPVLDESAQTHVADNSTITLSQLAQQVKELSQQVATLQAELSALKKEKNV